MFLIIIIKNTRLYDSHRCKGGYNMKKALAIALTSIAAFIGTVATTGCIIVLIDEPEMPEELL